jgi:hypothetical protein
MHDKMPIDISMRPHSWDSTNGNFDSRAGARDMIETYSRQNLYSRFVPPLRTSTSNGCTRFEDDCAKCRCRGIKGSKR